MFVVEDKVHLQSMLLEYWPFLFENIMPLDSDRVTNRPVHELVAVTDGPVEEVRYLNAGRILYNFFC